MTEHEKLPDGWVWVCYDQPTIYSSDGRAGLDATTSTTVTRVCQWGAIPIEVRTIFDQRLQQIEQQMRSAP